MKASPWGIRLEDSFSTEIWCPSSDSWTSELARPVFDEMRTSLRIYWTPKRGNTQEEYEDAFWPPEPLDLHSKLLRFAVADGATETSFAGSWAQILTRAYCRDRLSQKRIHKTLPRLQQEWNSSITSKSLPWYAEQKLSQGAFATLLGLTLLDGTWQSTSIGDSCLFQIRRNSVVTAFPINS